MAWALAGAAALFVAAFPVANAFWYARSRRRFECFSFEIGDYACSRTQWLTDSIALNAVTLAVLMTVFLAFALLFLVALRIPSPRGARISPWRGVTAIGGAALATAAVLLALK